VPTDAQRLFPVRVPGSDALVDTDRRILIEPLRDRAITADQRAASRGGTRWWD
jgi:hypothetical protein